MLVSFWFSQFKILLQEYRFVEYILNRSLCTRIIYLMMFFIFLLMESLNGSLLCLWTIKIKGLILTLLLLQIRTTYFWVIISNHSALIYFYIEYYLFLETLNWMIIVKLCSPGLSFVKSLCQIEISLSGSGFTVWWRYSIRIFCMNVSIILFILFKVIDILINKHN